MKKSNLLLTVSAVLAIVVIAGSIACSSGSNTNTSAANSPADGAQPPDAATLKSEKADVKKGIGEITHVELNNPLDETMVKRGKAIYEMKCSACHKLNTEKIVGPGWEGVSSRRTPEWIMNMITNTDVMLDKDPEAQKLLETCMVRMPNQGLSMGDCRDILEFMIKNDQKK